MWQRETQGESRAHGAIEVRHFGRQTFQNNNNEKIARRTKKMREGWKEQRVRVRGGR